MRKAAFATSLLTVLIVATLRIRAKHPDRTVDADDRTGGDRVRMGELGRRPRG